MRKPHPSYEMFIKEQKPKYGKTFLEWYNENIKEGEVNVLKLLQNKNIANVYSYEYGIQYSNDYYLSFKDFFSKKLQLCANVLTSLVHGFSNLGINQVYDYDKVADIMDLYEDIIQEISIRSNVSVATYPNGWYEISSQVQKQYVTQNRTFQNFDELMQEISTGIIVFYTFEIYEDRRIMVRYFKHEPLTRNVLFERTGLAQV